MGRGDVERAVSADRLREFSRRVLNDLGVLSRMLDEDLFDTGKRRIGAEQEMFLVDRNWQPASVGPAVLEAVADPHLTTELGKFNLELNLDPHVFEGRCLSSIECQLRELLDRVAECARHEGAHVVLTGILPTLGISNLDLEHMTPVPRYYALNDAMNRLSGGSPFELYIRGRDELRVAHDNVMFEACNTSFQVHLQVAPAEFAHLYNIAQAATAPVLAAATNSPMLFGRQLWRETRIAVFEQSIDTRARTGHLRKERRRVSFGSRWLDESVIEIFEEDIARFRAVLAADVDEDAFEVLERGDIPKLKALQLHNGTVYRWNRPCYGITDGRPHLRIENRVLPSGPSVVDEVANAAFWLGSVIGLGREFDDVRRHFEFLQVRENFVAAARRGLEAQLWWPGEGCVPAPELICKRLLPVARAGLESMAVDAEDVDRYLGIIEERVAARRSGAFWLVNSYDALRRSAPQAESLAAVVAATVARQSTGEPVHRWALAGLGETGAGARPHPRVEQLMTTDLFTVHEDDVVDLVAAVMKWRHIRRIPVEDRAGRLVGLVTYRSLLRVLGREAAQRSAQGVAVRDIMKRDVVSVSPSMSSLEAARLMRKQKIGCLPVVDAERRLVGIVTEHDYIELAWPLLEQLLALPDGGSSGLAGSGEKT